VIVHSVGAGADETAHSIEWVGDKSVHAFDGTRGRRRQGSKTVALKTADGMKETFVVADHFGDLSPCMYPYDECEELVTLGVAHRSKLSGSVNMEIISAN
jgi:hypothetical protein